MTKFLVTVGVSIFFILDLFSFGFTQETLSVTTYYPSPVGSYRELRANRVAVDPNRAMPATDGTLVWGPGRGGFFQPTKVLPLNWEARVRLS